MSLGVMLLGFALLSYLEAVLPESWRGKHNPPVFFLFFMAGVFAMVGLIKWGTKAIKKRITWPRTGYVAYRRDTKSWLLLNLAAAVLGAGIAGLMGFAKRHNAMSLPGGCYLALWVVGYAIWTYRMGREHP